MIDKNKVGIIRVAREVMEDGNLPDAFHALKVTVLRSEFMYARDCIEYECQSPLFDTVPEGVDAPIYDIIVHVAEDKTRTYEVKRYVKQERIVL